MRQFALELRARLQDTSDYDVALEEDRLRVIKTHKKGGLLGIGGQTRRTTVLEAIKEGDQVVIREETADQAFSSDLAERLKHH